MSHTPVYGLIGYPLSHSFSPGYFAEKFRKEGTDAIYQAFPLESITALPEWLATQPHLRGLNVTIPYKQAVIPYLHSLDEAAAAIGAVNCIDIREGKPKGYNTDVTGFRESIEPLLLPHHTQALVLGTGGAALAVAYALRQLGIAFTNVSRTPAAGQLAYNTLDAALIAEYTIIINTTPLGMYPNVTTAPDIPYSCISTRHLLYDLVYNPGETTFLKWGKQQGATIKNGYEMLVLQAEASWRIWNR